MGKEKEFLHLVALKKAQVDFKVIIANAFDSRGFWGGNVRGFCTSNTKLNKFLSAI